MTQPPLDLSGVPQAPGVYRFRDEQRRVLYVGRAVDLRRRVRSYWGSQRGRPRMRRMVPQIVAVELVVCASEHEAAWLERNLLEQSRPRWNRARGGLETPVYLRLDASPKAPSLTVVHEPLGDLPHFGPYLGGNRVRLAVSALSAIYPLAYAGDRLTGAERSMAQARGVAAADRPALVEALTGLLSGDPAAAAAGRALLEAKRDRAAKELEFEFAGRLQEQLEAVDWLVSPQRVTVPSQATATAAAWADGILVEFGIKDGRLRTWKQRSCTAAEAERTLVATPPQWVDFAQRTAELAARLQAAHARLEVAGAAADR